jgi:hypothetical protein
MTGYRVKFISTFVTPYGPSAGDLIKTRSQKVNNKVKVRVPVHALNAYIGGAGA